MTVTKVLKNIATTCRTPRVAVPSFRGSRLLWLPMVASVACAGAQSNPDTDDNETTDTSQATDEAVNPTVAPSSSETPSQPSTDQTSAASSDTNETTEDPNPGSLVKGVTSAGVRCDRANRLGSLSVNLGTDRTIVAGAVSNGVLPSAVAEVQLQSGGCELLVPRDLFCTSCASSETCAGDDVCVPKPVKVSAGVVSVEGLLVDTEVSPNGITLDYSKTLLEPYPAYDVGADLRLYAAGDVVPAFEASVYGVPKLTSALSTIAVKGGEAALLEWSTADVNTEQTNVFVSFSVNVHGAVTGWIECMAPDTGSFEIPAEMVSTLIDLGLSGFPRVDLERRSSATVELADGCVDVYVGSKVTIEIEVDGLVSCNEAADCPDGQTCSEELACE